MFDKKGRRVQELLAKAFNEGRDLTSDEKAECDRLIAEMKSERNSPREEQRRADAGIMKQLEEMGFADDPNGGAPRYKTVSRSVWGESFVKELSGGGRGFKTLTPSGSITVPSLASTIFRIEDRPLTLLDLIPIQPLEGTDTFSVLRETARTNNAAVVAAGATKPTSVYSLVRVDETVKTIAHLSEPIPRQTLADASLARAYLDGSLRSGVMLAVEGEIVNGDGTGEHFEGLDAVSGTLDQAWSTDLATTARKAITLLEGQNIFGAAFALNPADWERFDLMQDNEARFFSGGPFTGGSTSAPVVDRIRRKLWGHDVAVSNAIPAGTGWLVDWAGSTIMRERESVQVDWSENVYDSGSGKTDFERNLIRFRAEGRFGFLVTRPYGCVEIDLTA